MPPVLVLSYLTVSILCNPTTSGILFRWTDGAYPHGVCLVYSSQASMITEKHWSLVMTLGLLQRDIMLFVDRFAPKIATSGRTPLFEHVQSMSFVDSANQICQIWWESKNRRILVLDPQRVRFLVLTKGTTASGNENMLHPAVTAKLKWSTKCRCKSLKTVN